MTEAELRELMANHIGAMARLNQIADMFAAYPSEQHLIGLAHAGQECANAALALQQSAQAGRAAQAALAGKPITEAELTPVLERLDTRYQAFYTRHTRHQERLANIANAAKGVSIVRHNEQRQRTPTSEAPAMCQALNQLDEAIDANWPPGPPVTRPATNAGVADA